MAPISGLARWQPEPGSQPGLSGFRAWLSPRATRVSLPSLFSLRVPQGPREVGPPSLLPSLSSRPRGTTTRLGTLAPGTPPRQEVPEVP